MNLKKYNFSDNPFTLIPDNADENLPWAGFKSNKDSLDKIFREMIANNETKLILNLSRWGGGKTHSTFYYSRKENLIALGADPENIPFSILVTTPREGKNATNTFYKKVIDEIGISNISKLIFEMRTDKGDDDSYEDLKNWSKNEDIGRILWLMGDEDLDTSFNASELLFNKPTAKLRRDLKVRRGVEDDTDKFNAISAILKLLSLYTLDGKKDSERRVILWIDEFESLVYYSTKHYRPFTQALRELIDNTPKNFSLLINFSFADPDDMQTLEFLIGSALLDRVNDQVIFEEANIETAKEYVRELFSFFREDDFESDNDYYPFTEKSLTALLEVATKQTGKPLMPRTINKWCVKAIQISEKENTESDEIDSTILKDLSFVDEVFE